MSPIRDAILITVTFVGMALGFSSDADAQTSDDAARPPLASRSIPIVTPQLAPSAGLTPESAAARAAELQRWMDDYTEWIEWSLRWSNRREPGWFTSSRDRREKPAPPAWLAGRCELLVDDDDPLSSACTLVTEWQSEHAGLPVRSARLVKLTAPEESPKTIWWEHIHADVLWPAMQWQASVYGIIGMHTATTVRGRFQVFLAPGAMLLNVPARNGSRDWKLAANYGIGYRVLDFAFPGRRPAALHVNLARAWLLSDVTDAVTGRTTDFVGLSISFKKSR